MSIAIGIPCVDGVIVACDHQYSIGITKIAGPKLFPALKFYAPDSPNSSLIAVTDNAESGKKLSRFINDNLPDAFTLEEFVTSAEASLRQYLEKYIFPLPKEERDSLSCDVLLAAREGSRCALYRANGPMLVEQEFPVCIGEGLYLGNYLIRRLFPIISPSVEIASQMVAHVINAAGRYIPSVGEGTSIHILRQDGLHSSVLKTEREVIEKHFEAAFSSFADVMACCDSLSRSEDDLEHHLSTIKAEVTLLRKAHGNRIERIRKMAQFSRGTVTSSPESAEDLPSFGPDTEIVESQDAQEDF